MLPLEMKYDSSNVGWIDFNDCNSFLEKKEFDNKSYKTKQNLSPKMSFYLLPSTDDYILKLNPCIDKNDNGLYGLVYKLLEKQKDCPNIDFPIGITLNDLDVVGQIIKYYRNAKSIKNICICEDLSSLQKYIIRDEDTLHNLFMVYLEILDILEEMFESDISYFDVNGGNFVIYNNQVKIIDFEPEYISFQKEKYNEHIIIHNYLETLGQLIRALGINEYHDCLMNDKEFKKIKLELNKFENRIRSRNVY